MKTIPLTQGESTTVDDDMYEYLMQWKWVLVWVNGEKYAGRIVLNPDGEPEVIFMHDVVVQVSSERMN